MKRINLAAGLAFFLLLANVILYFWQPLGENFYLIGDPLVAMLALMAVIAGFYAFRLHGFGSVQGKALLFVTAGVFFWFMGELTWGIYEIALGVETPVASIADVFWFIGYPMFLLGLYYIFRLSSAVPGKKKLAVLVPAMVIALSLMVYLALPTLTDTAITTEEKITTAGYVVGDALLLAGLIFVIACLFGSRFAKPWSIVLLAIVVSSIADIYFMDFFSVYETGSLIDILWNADYILFAFGFLYYRETVKDIISVPQGRGKAARQKG